MKHAQLVKDRDVVPSVVVLAQSEDVPLVADDVTVSQALQALAVVIATVLLTLLMRRLLVRWATFHGSPHVGRTLGRFLSVVLVGIGLIYALDTRWRRHRAQR